MSILEVEIATAAAQNVFVNDDSLTVDLTDGRTITVPLAWFPRLEYGTQAEKEDWRLTGNQDGIHWPALDEDISIASLLAGRRSGENAASPRRWLAMRKPNRGS